MADVVEEALAGVEVSQPRSHLVVYSVKSVLNPMLTHNRDHQLLPGNDTRAQGITWSLGNRGQELAASQRAHLCPLTS